MISQADKDKAKKLGFDIDAIIKAHADEKEVSIAIPEGNILTDSQLQERDSESQKTGEKAGEKKAFEIAKKELGKAGFEIKSERFGDMATELKEKVNSTNDAKIKELQEQNTLLIADKNKLTTDITTVQANADKALFEADLMGKIPAIAPGLKSLKETIELAKLRGYSFEKAEDGTAIVKHNGEAIKDSNTHKALPLEAGIKTMFGNEGWDKPAQNPPAGGRGAQQQPYVAGDKPKNRTEAIAAYKEQNPDDNILSEKGQAFYQECAKVEGFNMYE